MAAGVFRPRQRRQKGVSMSPEVTLTTPSRDDVERLTQWLQDEDVNTSWYGKDDDGQPLHAGYAPSQILAGGSEEWDRVFNNENRKVFAVYTSEGDHIGEAQLVIEWPLLEAQAYILVGRKDLWHHHYGTTAFVSLLDHAFNDLGLHRIWVDVPEYNKPAMAMVEHIGFVVEGHFRKAHRRGDQWFDSYALGLLAEEYPRRRARLLESGI